MAFIAAGELPDKFNFKLDDQTDDKPIEFAQELAATDLEDWLTAEDFALGIAQEDPESDADKRKQKRIINAHAFLTVYYIYLNNTQIRASGTVDSEKGPDNESTVRYLKPKELEQQRGFFLEAAKNQIAGFAKVDFSEHVEPADTSLQFFGSFSQKKLIRW